MNHTTLIDRLFERLYAVYGAEWERSLGHAPIGSIKTNWLHELAPYFANKDTMTCIAWALGNLPERCPNVIVFKNLCLAAPRTTQIPLPGPKADPLRVAEELAKLAPMRNAQRVDYKAWAKRILADVDNGIKRNPTSVKMAREALEAQ